MKKLLLLSSLLLLGFSALQAQVSVKINGSQTFVLNESNGIYFHNDSLTIDGETFALDDIQVITLQATNSIADIEEESLALMPNPVQEVLTLRGIGNEPQTVTLYSTAGVKLMEQKASDGTVINIGHLPEGVYILRCGNRAAKVVKQM
ncbi:MAG: T9SS type A sorting domain-containing protein [Bacteroidales bacterium]|nr:T9SS type A sorting domain-containing protein [Bacteroidales bacterium]